MTRRTARNRWVCPVGSRCCVMVVIDEFVREQSGADPSPQDDFAHNETCLADAVECDDYGLVVELVERALTLPR
jgi:hypothetical protein